MADRVELIVRRDPVRQVLPVKHLPFRLRVEERHDGVARVRLVEAEDGERSLGERQSGERHAAAEHVTAGECWWVHSFIFYAACLTSRDEGQERRALPGTRGTDAPRSIVPTSASSD